MHPSAWHAASAFTPLWWPNPKSATAVMPPARRRRRPGLAHPPPRTSLVVSRSIDGDCPALLSVLAVPRSRSAATQRISSKTLLSVEPTPVVAGGPQPRTPSASSPPSLAPLPRFWAAPSCHSTRRQPAQPTRPIENRFTAAAVVARCRRPAVSACSKFYGPPSGPRRVA